MATAAVSPDARAPDREPGPVPDPFDDVEALEDLEEEITELAAHIHAATYRLLVLLADFDRRRGWELGGHRSCAHWLHRTTGIDLGACRERVRVARALGGLPRTGEAMSRGELSFSQVRALTRVATAECEAELLEVARHATTAELERMIRQWRLGALGGGDEEKRERRRYRLRRLVVVPDEGGMYVVRGRLTAEVGALLMRAVEAASDALFRETSGATAETTPTQRRADALGLLAERALAAGFGPEDGSAETPGRGDAPVGARVPVSGTRPERYQVFVHLEPAALRKNAEPAALRKNGEKVAKVGAENAAGEARGCGCSGHGSALGPDGIVARALSPRSHLEDGTRLATDTARRLCCDAALVRVLHDAGGEILDLGRRTRTVSAAQRRALEIRDGGCRWPGCGLRFTDAHHLVHWTDGGSTDLDNLILLCSFHHRKVHEGGWRVEFWGRERRAAFLDPRGRIHMDGGATAVAGGAAASAEGRAPEAAGTDREGREALEGRLVKRPPRPRLPARPWEALVREHAARGIEPEAWKLGRGWRAEIPWPLHARALEALDEAHWDE